MHRKYRYTKVNYINIHISNILSDSTTTTKVNLAKFTDLPNNIVAFQH